MSIDIAKIEKFNMPITGNRVQVNSTLFFVLADIKFKIFNSKNISIWLIFIIKEADKIKVYKRLRNLKTKENYCMEFRVYIQVRGSKEKRWCMLVN